MEKEGGYSPHHARLHRCSLINTHNIRIITFYDNLVGLFFQKTAYTTIFTVFRGIFGPGREQNLNFEFFFKLAKFGPPPVPPRRRLSLSPRPSWRSTVEPVNLTFYWIRKVSLSLKILPGLRTNSGEHLTRRISPLRPLFAQLWRLENSRWLCGWSPVLTLWFKC